MDPVAPTCCTARRAVSLTASSCSSHAERPLARLLMKSLSMVKKPLLGKAIDMPRSLSCAYQRRHT